MKTLRLGISALLASVTILTAASDVILLSQAKTYPSLSSAPVYTNSPSLFSNAPPAMTNITPVGTNVAIKSTKMMITSTNETTAMNSPAMMNPYSSSNGPALMKVNSTAPAASAYTNTTFTHPPLMITNTNP